ncbi:MAG: SDR family NAD(P)-dependent oxidoreductase [Pseudomonadota bacterium]
MQDLSGKTAFVTGAASGIGFAIARALAAEGMRLALADIDLDALRAAEAELRDAGAETLHLRFDVSDPAAWAAAAEHAAHHLGEADLLINNAGVSPARVPAEQITPEDWAWLMSINLNGVHNGISAWLPRMKRRGTEAHIVNTASILGHFGMANASDYVASKYAVVGLSECLRIELRDTPVGVSVLCPGLVATPLRENSARERPSAKGAPNPEPAADPARPGGIPAEQVAAQVIEAVRTRRFWIGTHPEYGPVIEARAAEIAGAFAGEETGEDIAFLAGGALAAHRG